MARPVPRSPQLPPLLRMVWDTSPALSVCSGALRLIASATPLATLYVSKLIIDLVVQAIRGQAIDKALVFKLLALELALAVASDGLGRLITWSTACRTTGLQTTSA